MAIKLIKSEKEYQEAILQLEKTGDNPDFENDENLIDEFELLEKLITDYETENYQLDKGDPIEIIKLKMNYMDLIQKDLIDIIGSKGVVSEVLNKKRGLSKVMIRNLSKFLGINQDILNTHYELLKEEKVIIKKTELYQFDFNDAITQCIDLYSNRVRNNGMVLNVQLS
ncbi:helix-turn-helix domain-containing protein [Lacinutrix jangbogonensis]|uniref:helix-turn-helix domain-containing protein n=1 Tax=Lacinutrix jangbogonensis TaxID=1469557 RepID=UPI00068FB2CE|nr:hypothetical protein [Lacinutrix jangbogonensis]